ncbi:tricarboxylate transport protein, mitochondrial precursor [Atractiella rhizophila]|nr:tricarboxylate transport protein, mitochondrial precursor [Atractiella rhizophila]
MGAENGKNGKKTLPSVGGVEAALTYPFEFAKTRAQLRASPSSSTAKPSRNPFSVLLQAYKNEGLRSIYRGVGIMVIGSVGKDAVRFLSFDTVKNAFASSDGTLTPMRSMGAGMAARVKTALIDDARSAKRFANTSAAIKAILKEDGLIGLYRGFQGTTLKQAGATSFRMGSYNILKDFESRKGIKQSTVVNFANGACAGVITTLATQPFDTIKTRSQAAKTVTTMMEAIRDIWADGGIKSFWRGTVMRLGRTVFAGGILFTTAEAVAKVVEPVLSKGV